MSAARFHGVRLVVFDLDGTLIDSAGDLKSALNATLDRLAPGTEPLSLDTVRAFVGDGARTLVQRALDARGINAAPQDVLALFLEAYRRRMLDTTVLYPGAREALQAIQPGRQLAILSNKPGEMTREIVRRLGVADRFARIWGGDDAPRKPDPTGLLRLAQELRVAAAETVMVGDSANDVLTARAAGVACVGVSYGFAPDGMREARPDAMIDGLHELAGLVG